MQTLIPLMIVLGLIFIVPLICHKIHIPAIIGFILVGVGLGPCGLNILADTPAVQVFGQLGMLYIMFQAGVEIDINDFKQQRNKAIIFGLLTFCIPLLLGYGTSRLLGLSPVVGLLLGAMYGSHTLMTYPIVRRYGLQKSAASNITVGGTMIALALSLLVLAGVQTKMQTGSMELIPLLIWAAKVVGVIALILGGFPWLVRTCFKFRWETTTNFILVFAVTVLSALLCTWAGLSGVLGAFLCGVALNRLIPNLSQLMNHITFVGNSMFVPVFLIEVGLMLNLQAVGSWGWLGIVAAVMIVTKLVGKWLAAACTQWLFRLQANERQLIFGLSHATAAGTLAIVTIVYQMGLFDDAILNGAIVMILVLCTTASFA
ncbi:MAG: cation:proton antiporter, partial [Paludibacteraceae bacterium]|nr:cation:proton antiporter [Paludibacteraceae bacterium]